MTFERSTDYYVSVVRNLCTLSSEEEWVEFKRNTAEPQEIGEYISALSNSAALIGKPSAYLVWGVEDGTHNLVGTSFRPSKVKVGNEDFENWLLRLLSPQVSFRFFEFEIDAHTIVLLVIEPASKQPIQFSGVEYIRVRSYKKKLKDHPEKERALWRVFENASFEDGIAAENVSSKDVFQLLNSRAHFRLLNQPFPEASESNLSALASDHVISRCDTGNWNILNLGAILLARRLSDFGSLGRKAVRVIIYRGKGRVDTIREQEGAKGYASGFEGLIEFVNILLPSNEVIGQALRRNVPMYPELAVRELVANALIHQDFQITGAGPMIEIFDDRMEITNPGKPLVETQRFLDSAPQSRNEALASFMRRAGICEERGSGIDKVVFQTEFYQLPAPVFETSGDSTRAILFGHRPMNKMDKGDRVRACYLHACLKYVTRENMTNSTLRARFGIEKKNAALASKIIKDTVDAELIRPHDETVGSRAMRYEPFWV